MAHSTLFPNIAFAALVVAGGVLVSPSSVAQTPMVQTQPEPAASAPHDTIRLSDEERNTILASNTSESAASARGEMTDSDSAGRGIHGEVGVMIGSHGTRSAYGVAEIPLGDNAGAVVSFESSRFGSVRR